MYITAYVLRRKLNVCWTYTEHTENIQHRWWRFSAEFQPKLLNSKLVSVFLNWMITKVIMPTISYLLCIRFTTIKLNKHREFLINLSTSLCLVITVQQVILSIGGGGSLNRPWHVSFQLLMLGKFCGQICWTEPEDIPPTMFHVTCQVYAYPWSVYTDPCKTKPQETLNAWKIINHFSTICICTGWFILPMAVFQWKNCSLTGT